MKRIFFKRALAIVIILCAVFGLFYLYLPPQYCSISAMNKEVGVHKVDVVCVGSSHAFNGVCPVQLYEKYGMAAYVCGGGGQAPWHSYYYIKRIIKDQNPKLIVLDIYAIGRADSTVVDYKHTVDNMLAFPFSIDKIKAIKASGVDNWMDFLLIYPFTHDDYLMVDSLTVDKISYGDRILGYIYNSGEYDGEISSVCSDYSEKEPIDLRSEQYLRMCINLCNETGTQILLINTPWPNNKEEYQRRFNYISDIASECGVPILDGCLLAEDIGVNYKEDSYDGSHLNYSGAVKWTSYIGEYINKNYEIPDRREQSEYIVYNDNMEKLKMIIASEND